jgi:hypothetical protein
MKGSMQMLSLGSKQRPIIVKMKSEGKSQKIAEICDHFGWKLTIMMAEIRAAGTE